MLLKRRRVEPPAQGGANPAGDQASAKDQAVNRPASPPAAQLIQRKPVPARRIVDLKELPEYTCILTAEKGQLKLRPDAREGVALLKVGKDRAALVYVNAEPWTTEAKYASRRAKDEGYQIVERLVCVSTDLMIQIYASGNAEEEQEFEASRREAEPNEMELMFDRILAEAVQEGASDIHIEVDKDRARVYRRIHGDLDLLQSLTRSVADQLTRAIYTWCTEKGASFNPMAEAYDAKLKRTVKVRHNGIPIDTEVSVRFATMPVSPGGWDVTLRILATTGSGGTVKTLTGLGYGGPQIDLIVRMLSRQEGLILCCGVTGSGKSTTLQTFLKMLNSTYKGRKKIRTIEDPVEYVINGARQTPVLRQTGTGEDSKEQAGKKFSEMVISSLRNDPDIVMIGEIRDEPTARAVYQLVQTGHLVLSTLHATNGITAMQRLMNLGIDREVLCSEDFLIGIISQKLLPTLCASCKEPQNSTEGIPMSLLHRIGAIEADAASLRFEGRGCEDCKKRGVDGRTVVAEFLLPDKELLELIHRGDITAARAYWRMGGRDAVSGRSSAVAGRTRLDHAIEKMKRGEIDPRHVESHLGQLDDQEKMESARQYYNRYKNGRH